MAPTNPKRPPRPAAQKAAEADGEPGFEEGRVLNADDPRPQLVPQYPVRRNMSSHPAKIPKGGRSTRGEDLELKPTFDRPERAVQPAFLYVERGPGQGQLLPLAEGAIVLGRSSTADFRLQHPSISRRHAQITREGTRFFIKDLHSQNGTFINRTRVTREVEVSPGDQIALGTVLLKLRAGKNGSQAPRLSRAPEGEGTESEDVSRSYVHRPAAERFGKAWLFAGAVGVGLIGTLAITLIRSATPVPVDVPTPTVRAPKATRAAPAEGAPARPAAEPARRSAQREPARRAEPPGAPAPAAPAAPAPRPRPVAQAVPPPEPTPAEAPPGQDEGASVAAAIRAKYEEGSVDSALVMAKRARATDWVRRLNRFAMSYQAAQAALAAHDVDAATRYIHKALEADEQIAEGWGTYNAELRSELTAITARTTPNARIPLPSEARPPSGAKAPPHTKVKRSAIDAAFDG